MAIELSTIKSPSPFIPILPNFELLSLEITKYLLSLQQKTFFPTPTVPSCFLLYLLCTNLSLLTVSVKI